MSTHSREGSIEPDKDGTNILPNYLFYTKEDPKNYPFINITHASLAIDSFLVIRRILGIIRGPNSMLNH